MPDPNRIAFSKLTSEVVAAYVVKNHVQPGELPALIASVHAVLAGLGQPEAPVEEAAPLVPPVSIRKSITDDYLISMEDGKRYQVLKRHLATQGLTPAEYRAKWGLPHDYPMVAPAYAAKRSELAKRLRLGRRGSQDTVESAPEG